MIEWTFEAFEAFYLFTRFSFVYQRVKLLFLPSMTVLTLLQSLATFIIAGNEGTTLPVIAEFDLIFKEVWLPSKILKVMRIDTLCFVVIVVVGAPLSFKVEDIEIEI